MSSNTPTLHLVCGKIAAGKSTLTKQLGQAPETIVISEDAWLSALYGDQMKTLRDYVLYAAKLRGIMGPHVVSLLTRGLSVVLDFQANTVQARTWMRDLLNQTNADHILHYLDTPDGVCIARMHARNSSGEHPFTVTEAEFHQVNKYFAPPTPQEGFMVKRHVPPETA
ncbi:AAA family ATPase [Shimia abyssi]|uniref:Putative kinase n=1 Tax=Shimia abyssi TaxID=1662395 RepID=A0A2P8FC99_9RHOB|nr:ATP-binding protein [Shimia abyssi]PSL19335.1 putative kinase [Shimia abyssi]